jgi:hypothetical protein
MHLNRSIKGISNNKIYCIKEVTRFPGSKPFIFEPKSSSIKSNDLTSADLDADPITFIEKFHN